MSQTTSGPNAQATRTDAARFVGSVINDLDTLSTLPTGSLVLVVDDASRATGVVFENYGGRDGGQWVELDPSDRDDGENTVPSLYLAYKASRWGKSDGYILLLSVPGTSPAPPFEQPVALPASALAVGAKATVRLGRMQAAGIIESLEPRPGNELLLRFVGSTDQFPLSHWKVVSLEPSVAPDLSGPHA